MNKSCMESEHPSIFICDKIPGDDHSRQTHFRITEQLREIKKREKKRKLRRNKRKTKMWKSKMINKRKGKAKGLGGIKKGKMKRKGFNK